MKASKIFLASQSPRRKALLESIGLTPIVVPPDPAIDAESLEEPQAKEDPRAYVARVASLKHKQGLMTLKSWGTTEQAGAHDLLIAADTTVALDKTLFGKPKNPAQAIAMLGALSGKTHEVHTAVHIARLDLSREHSIIVSSQVTFASLTDCWITEYVKSGEPMDKAGAYAIQGRAQVMIPQISGSYSNIVGLPLHETWRLIQATIAA